MITQATWGDDALVTLTESDFLSVEMTINYAISISRNPLTQAFLKKHKKEIINKAVELNYKYIYVSMQWDDITLQDPQRGACSIYFYNFTPRDVKIDISDNIYNVVHSLKPLSDQWNLDYYYSKINYYNNEQDVIDSNLTWVSGNIDANRLNYGFSVNNLDNGQYTNLSNVTVANVGLYGFVSIFPGGDEVTSGKYPSSTMGGDGTYDDTTEVIEYPTYPTTNIGDYGFISLWKLRSAEQLKSLAKLVWSKTYTPPMSDVTASEAVADMFKQFIEIFKELPETIYNYIWKPMDYIISVGLMPMVPIAEDAPFVLGGQLYDDIIVPQIGQQFQEFDFGWINVNEYFGSALDYSPYTECAIYLPYIGYQQLSLNEIMNGTINLRYRFDFLTGQFIATLKVKKDKTPSGQIETDAILYQWSGNAKTEIPLTNGNYQEYINTMATLATQVLVPMATGLTGIGGVLANTEFHDLGVLAMGAGQVSKKVGESVGNMAQSVSHVTHGNAMSNVNGLLGVQESFLILYRPIQSLPEGYNNYEGYPCNITTEIKNMTGYFVVGSVHLENINATSSELLEIENMLKNGVII